jgi:hypothetical protein
MFEMFQRMVNPMSFPLQSLLFPSLDIREIDRKISELKTVQTWLNANASMLELTIKTLEYQRSVLAPQEGGGKEAKPPENPFANPALWPWGMMAQGSATKDKGQEQK